MKLEKGMYVRTKYGIFKIRKITKDLAYWKHEKRVLELDRNIPEYNYRFSFYKDESIFKGAKFKDNIIDLIKHKDIILGKDGKLYQCWKVYKDYVFTHSKNKQGQTITLVDYQIDRVMCYERFESMSYKVGE